MASTLATSPSAPPGGVLLAGLITSSVGLVVGVGYGLAVAYVPFVNVLTLLGAAIFGGVMAWAGAKGFEAGRVRHREAGLAIVMIATTLGFYVSWVIWVAALFETTEALSLAWRPVELMRSIETINAAGPWKFQGWRPTGNVLWGLWFIEALLIFGLAYKGTEREQERLLARPFCTECKQWIGRAQGIANFALGEDEASVVREHIRAREWEYFTRLGLSEDVDNGHRVLVAQCECGKVQCATVERNTRAPGEIGDCTFLAKELVLGEGELKRIEAPARLAARAWNGWPGRRGAPRAEAESGEVSGPGE